MIKRVITIILIISLTLISCISCSTAKTLEQDERSRPETVSFTDSAGRIVEVPSNITRIAASGPMSQIVLFPLAADLLVGLAGKWDSNTEKYIDKKYLELPVLGQFYGKGDLNLEELAKADPQVIIDVGESKPGIAEDMDSIMNQVGIPTVHIQANTETMADAYRTLGKLLKRESEAEVLARYCEEVLNELEDIMAKVGEENKANLVYCVGEDGLNVIARGSFHAEILDRVCNNVAVVDDISSKGTGNPVDMEQLLLWDPDVIIFAPDSVYDTVAGDNAWQELKAIKNGNYYEVPSGPYNWIGSPPSVNRFIGIIWITQLLYPEYAGYNLFEETARFYRLFYHCELTQEQYGELVANSLPRQ